MLSTLNIWAQLLIALLVLQLFVALILVEKKYQPNPYNTSDFIARIFLLIIVLLALKVI